MRRSTSFFSAYGKQWTWEWHLRMERIMRIELIQRIRHIRQIRRSPSAHGAVTQLAMAFVAEPPHAMAVWLPECRVSAVQLRMQLRPPRFAA